MKQHNCPLCRESMRLWSHAFRRTTAPLSQTCLETAIAFRDHCHHAPVDVIWVAPQRQENAGAIKLRRQARGLMRQYAMMFRGAVEFARRYRDYNPTVHERWLLNAGRHLAAAEQARNNAQRMVL